MSWVCSQSLNRPFICFITLAIKQVQTEEIKPCCQQIESKQVCCLDCMSIKTVPKHSASIKTVRIYELIIMFPDKLSRLMCYMMLRI